jgi:alkylhydroperoxidase family enzyme
MNEAQMDAREHQILGAPPRIEPLRQDELSEEAADLARDIGAVLGYEAPEELTTYFAIMSRHPRLYRSQIEAGIQLLGSGALPPQERELMVLRTAWLCGAPYEWAEHVAIARKLGITEEMVDRITLGPEAPGWSELHRALLLAVAELVDDKMISDATWAILAAHLDDRQLIELPALVGQYVAVAMIQNSLRLPLTNDRRGFRER